MLNPVIILTTFPLVLAQDDEFVIVLMLFLQNGETPLHAAALFGHLKIVKILLLKGANPYTKNKVNRKYVSVL